MLSPTSRRRLSRAHPDLAAVIAEAAKDTAVPFQISSGARTQAEQDALYAKGRTKPGPKVTWTRRSRHIGGFAVDLVAMPGGKVSWDWAHYRRLAAHVKTIAQRLGVPVEWGGDWKSVKDGPHFQLPWTTYPQSSGHAISLLAHKPVDRARFDKAVGYQIAHEGGYVNHPADPGSHTKYGVTIGTLGTYLGRKATGAEVKRLTKATARDVYLKLFWVPMRCDDLPAGVDYAVFFLATHRGTGGGKVARELQKVVGAEPDGVIGPKTIAAARAADPRTTVNRLLDAHLAYLKTLRHWRSFGRGWTNRIEGWPGGRKGVRELALGLVETAPAPAPPDDDEQEQSDWDTALALPTWLLVLVLMGRAVRPFFR